MEPEEWQIANFSPKSLASQNYDLIFQLTSKNVSINYDGDLIILITNIFFRTLVKNEKIMESGTLTSEKKLSFKKEFYCLY